MKIACWIAFAFFIYATIVQYNDPDALVWMAQYGFAAIASLFFAIQLFKGVHVVWISIAISIFQLGFYIKAISEDNFMNAHPIEFASELGGTIVVLVWTIILSKVTFLNRMHHEEAS